MRTSKLSWLLAVAACSSSPGQQSDAGDDAVGSSDAQSDAQSDAAAATGSVGSVGGVMDTTCPGAAPSGATCKQLTVSGCPGIETEALTATIMIVAPTGTRKGTIVHFSGSGGEEYELAGLPNYQTAGFLQVSVSWSTDWEQTHTKGIKTAACRPATVLKWVFDEPTLHAGSRTLGFCGQGMSGGSGQLAYALAHYGMADYLDYVNELSGPPFARIDLGCDSSQPSTAEVCGVADTMRLPSAKLNAWENVTTCGSTNPPAADVAKWMADSIAIGGVYNYPSTEVQFFDCTNQATAVTGMAQIYYQQVLTAEGSVPSLASYHCYSQTDGCVGENLGVGDVAAVDAMFAGCAPHH
jgi:hypothetical protein